MKTHVHPLNWQTLARLHTIWTV